MESDDPAVQDCCIAAKEEHETPRPSVVVLLDTWCLGGSSGFAA
jgi:hypothetical protein